MGNTVAVKSGYGTGGMEREEAVTTSLSKADRLVQNEDVMTTCMPAGTSSLRTECARYLLSAHSELSEQVPSAIWRRPASCVRTQRCRDTP
jgi:hypothetical protein